MNRAPVAGRFTSLIVMVFRSAAFSVAVAPVKSWSSRMSIAIKDCL
jgi:hypothetical protein